MNERACIVVSGPTLFEMKQDRSLSLVEGVLVQSDVGNLLGANAHEVCLRGIHPAHSDSLDQRCVQSIFLLFGPGLVSSYGLSLFSFRVYGRGKLSIFFFSSLDSSIPQKSLLKSMKRQAYLNVAPFCSSIFIFLSNSL
jgi:hypothetical protein